jgi:hypothetical protein
MTTLVKNFDNINLKENNYMIEEYENGVLIETSQEFKDELFKNRTLDKKTLKWFRNLGGKESIKQGYKFGIGCTINTSISPDGNTKVIRYFFY